MWQRAAEATRRIDRRSDSKALRGYAAGKAEICFATAKQSTVWQKQRIEKKSYVEPKHSKAKNRTSNALCGFVRVKVAKMSDGTESKRYVWNCFGVERKRYVMA